MVKNVMRSMLCSHPLVETIYSHVVLSWR